MILCKYANILLCIENLPNKPATRRTKWTWVSRPSVSGDDRSSSLNTIHRRSSSKWGAGGEERERPQPSDLPCLVSSDRVPHSGFTDWLCQWKGLCAEARVSGSVSPMGRYTDLNVPALRSASGQTVLCSFFASVSSNANSKADLHPCIFSVSLVRYPCPYHGNGGALLL